MRIAVVNETSAGDKNKDILSALDNRGHDVINAGMKEKGGTPELTYIHTGFLSALLMNAGVVDFIIGGCGTGQGFLNSVMQYPGMFCGLIQVPTDAFLFAKINGGNCVSLALNFGYGWAGDVNMNFIFDRLFAEEFGSGYPEHRKASQADSRKSLVSVSGSTHKHFSQIVKDLPDKVVKPVLTFPGVIDILNIDKLEDKQLKTVLKKRT
jgi:ribose 5-phosphate isomerase RpiB